MFVAFFRIVAKNYWYLTMNICWLVSWWESSQICQNSLPLLVLQAQAIGPLTTTFWCAFWKVLPSYFTFISTSWKVILWLHFHFFVPLGISLSLCWSAFVILLSLPFCDNCLCRVSVGEYCLGTQVIDRLNVN